MTIMVDARALWWHEPEVCDCASPDEDFPCPHDTAGGWDYPMALGTIDGWTYITDRYVLLPVARIGGLPVGYAKELRLQPIPGQSLDGFAEWMAATVLPDPSPRLFSKWMVDPLEQAGFRIRPLDGVKDAHGICDPDLSLVGLVIPLRRALEAEATAARVVAV